MLSLGTKFTTRYVMHFTQMRPEAHSNNCQHADNWPRREKQCTECKRSPKPLRELMGYIFKRGAVSCRWCSTRHTAPILLSHSFLGSTLVCHHAVLVCFAIELEARALGIGWQELKRKEQWNTKWSMNLVFTCSYWVKLSARGAKRRKARPLAATPKC